MDDSFTLARRRFHHFTFYGFMSCFAATTVDRIRLFMEIDKDTAPTLGGDGSVTIPFLPDADRISTRRGFSSRCASDRLPVVARTDSARITLSPRANHRMPSECR